MFNWNSVEIRRVLLMFMIMLGSLSIVGDVASAFGIYPDIRESVLYKYITSILFSVVWVKLFRMQFQKSL